MQPYLDKAKNVAKFMLDMPYENVKDFEGIFIVHPFFNAIIVADTKGLFNIEEEPNRFKELKDNIRNRIDRCKCIEDIMLLILDSNKINFLYLLYSREVPAEICGNLLGSIWSTLENNDTQEDFIKNAMREWLIASDRTTYMTEEELELLQNLPDKVTIYRGAQFDEPADGFCWSLKKSVGEWFANRFQNKHPVLYTATIDKNDILFYTNSAEEEETVVDYTKIEEINVQKL